MSSFSASSTTASAASHAQVGVLHGASYVGGELIRLLTDHPAATLAATTSSTFAGESIGAAHPALHGQVNHTFAEPDALDLDGLDALFVAGEHGQSMHLVPDLLDADFDGPVVDLSADFRFHDASVYPSRFDTTHPAPELLTDAIYGLPELNADAENAQLIANPGCYATGIALALAPLAGQNKPLTAHVTALTGASGSGARPSAATHFPDRDGNVRPYKVLDHQHTPEVQQAIGSHVDLQFVPASGPWTRGIWGTAQIDGCAAAVSEAAVTNWFADVYAEAPCVRCTPGTLPSLQPTVGTPFCDLGWTTDDDTLVVGFALDNLLKGAASQAVQNLNCALGLPQATGLLPQHAFAESQLF
jgi:N-acetyl-gamma-glutamyl-phosphate reductase